jgi:hypothetical protein
VTNSQLITMLRQAAKDTNTGRLQRTDAVYAGILTLAQNFLNRELELCRKEFSLTLVASTRAYTADAAFLKFPRARLRQKGACVYWGAGNLEPTTAARLDAEETGWRDAADGTPSRFFLETAMSGASSILRIALDKKPSASFVADVPTLTYFGIVRPADIAANSNYPFDNNRLFEDLDNLLLQWSLAEISRQDGNHEKADASMQKLVSYLDVARDWAPGELKVGDGFRFGKDWRA